MDIYAEGSNVIFGKIGHFLVITAFVAALISSISYLLGTYKKSNPEWISLGRFSFLLHVISVLGIVALLFMVIHYHMFEYHYAWKHSSNALPFKYLFASFWEGQEGSTLLWMFWHAVIGMILMFTAKKWESPVMVMMALAQTLLASMLLGIVVFGHKFGSSPFALIKDAMDLPIFKMNPNFVPEDGSGLNPLLQNYWMTIHPPTLFLGYALCIVPFAYAMASLMTRSYNDWIKPVLPWTLTAVMVLGIGILMGGAWAYEALSFGGFWAWDPVENASLVPWIMMVAGLHTLMAYKHTGHSLIATYLMFIFSFLLILYSSYLTKSGILGDSSVHSFTDEGMSAQLRFMIFIFLIPSIALIIVRFKELPQKRTEEATSSREFWLFVGSLVFVLSTIYIAGVTSLPVFNKILGTNWAMPSDINLIYNDVLIWVAIMLGNLMAIGQYFNYKKTSGKKIANALWIPLLISLVLSVLVIVVYKFYRLDYALMTFASVFGIFGNLFFIITKLKTNVSNWGGSISHIGFTLMMLGILISQGRQEVVSYNQFGVDYGEGFSDQDKAENLLLYINESSTMQNYKITYIGDSITDNGVFYKVKYEPNNQPEKAFVLKPQIQIDPKMGNVANPSTKRTLSKDLYTHITSAPITDEGRVADSIMTETFRVKIGDTLQLSRSAAIVHAINPNTEVENFELGDGDLAIGAQMSYVTLDSSYQIEPKFIIQEQIARSIPLTIEEKDITFVFSRIFPESEEIELIVTQKYPRFIIMKAIQFPMINLLWLGALVMSAGVFMSIMRRRKLNKEKEIAIA
jgi:cytochrome c-type biogenesis protein CcmF